MSFSQDQRVFIVEHYFASRSYACVVDEFRVKYPNVAVPNNSTITRLIARFRETGSVSDKKRTGRPTVLTDAKLAEVRNVMLHSPSKSLRRLSAHSQISYGSAQKAMKKLKFHAYHVRSVHELREPDKEKRLVYCRWFRSFIDSNGIGELDRVFFSDEAWFHLSGYVNSQNSRIWSTQNPHALHETPLHSQKIGVWCAISRRRIVGPIFFETTVNSVVYQDIITQFISLLEINEGDCWLQQDNATCHTSNRTMNFLRKFFGERIISKGLWPPRSPDLTPPDFFLCVHNNGDKLNQCERIAQVATNVRTRGPELRRREGGVLIAQYPSPGAAVAVTLVLIDWSDLEPSNNMPRNCGARNNKTGNWKMALHIGTWNVRTLFKTGSMNCMVREIERYKVKLVALQEIRWSDTGSINTSDTIILYGKCDNQRQLGTGFAVHKSLVPAIKEFRDVNPRISVLTIRAQWFDVSLISVHAPTEDNPQEGKETFYDDLESTINTLPNNNIQILLGDLNAKIGKETAFKPTIGLHSLHNITNDNGLRLVYLATGKGFIIKSTMFPQKNIHKGTWRSPDGRYTNQIDHVLINSRFSNCIQDVRTVRGADCDSDHYLVKVKMKLKLKKKERREKMTLDNYDISKLRDQILGNVFKDEMRSQIDKINPSMMDTVDNRWRIIQNTIKSVSETVIGMKKKNPSKPWFNKVCEVALSKRKNARNTWLNESSNEEKERRYKECQKEANKIFRNEKRRYTQDI
ncbi:hypothetical protein QTP88_028094 [Uroleucon formosanum]